MFNTGLLVYGYLLLHLSVNVYTLKTENIIGGQLAKISKFPYHVLVRTPRSNCNGAIITEWHVVTSAHCVIDESGEIVGVKVAAGVDNSKNSEFKFYANASEIYMHADFDHKKNDKLFEGDIAVLKLDRVIPLDNKYMKKVTLPELLTIDNLELFTHKQPTITGYGYNKVSVTFSDGNKPVVKGRGNGYLHSAKTRILTVDECTMLQPYKAINFMKAFCSQMKQSMSTTPMGACAGDSGGPLVLENKGQNTLIGILSCGPIDCNEKILPAMYTRVSFYRGFIDKAISGICNEKKMSVKNHYPSQCTVQ